jgi:uncharacterized protein (DUF433 family)
MAITQTAHIHLDDAGSSWIDDTNVKVIEVVLDKIAYGWDAEKIHDEYPHLSLAQIHAALSYYYDHKTEMDREIETQLQRVEEAAARAGTPAILARLRASGKLP